VTVRAAIEEIATDAIAQFHPDTFWPAHPSDDGVGDGNTLMSQVKHSVRALSTPCLLWGCGVVLDVSCSGGGEARRRR
jgi:hypothetical protein